MNSKLIPITMALPLFLSHNSNCSWTYTTGWHTKILYLIYVGKKSLFSSPDGNFLPISLLSLIVQSYLQTPQIETSLLTFSFSPICLLPNLVTQVLFPQCVFFLSLLSHWYTCHYSSHIITSHLDICDNFSAGFLSLG